MWTLLGVQTMNNMQRHIQGIERESRRNEWVKQHALTDETHEFQRELDAERVAERFTPMFKRMKTVSKMDIPKPVPLFGGWLNENEVSLIHSYTGVGKSWFCIAIAVAVAGGGGFIGWQAEQTPSKVAYLDGELGLSDLYNMADQMTGYIGANRDCVMENLVLFHETDDGDQGEPRFDLTNPAIQDFVIDRLIHNKVKLCVIDNVRMLFKLKDENSASEWAIINDFLVRLRKHTAVLLVHHDNKSGDFSGSGNAATVVNSRIQLTAVDSTHNLIGCGTAFDVEFMKVRGLRTGAHRSQTVGLHPVNGWQVRFDRVSEFQRVYEAVSTGEHTSQAQVADALGMTTSKLSRLLREFDPDGEIKQMLKDNKVDGSDNTDYFDKLMADDADVALECH